MGEGAQIMIRCPPTSTHASTIHQEPAEPQYREERAEHSPARSAVPNRRHADEAAIIELDRSLGHVRHPDLRSCDDARSKATDHARTVDSTFTS